MNERVRKVLPWVVVAAVAWGREYFIQTTPSPGEILSSVSGLAIISDQASRHAAQRAISKANGGERVSTLLKAPIGDWFVAVTESRVFWISSDFRYVVHGDVVDTAGGVNLSRVLTAQWLAARQEGLISQGQDSDQAALAAIKTKSPSQASISEAFEAQSRLQEPDELELIQAGLLANESIESAGPASSSIKPDPEGVDIARIGFKSNGAAMTPEETRRQVAKVSETIPDDFTIKYAAPKERAVITAFVDYTCSACRKLHNAIPALNEQGISVRLLMYPRARASGAERVADIVIRNMSYAWCSPDKKSAFTDLYENGEIQPADCSKLPKSAKRIPPPIEEHFALGEIFGLTGTPYIFMGNGTVVPGFTSADDIAKQALQ